MAAGAAALVFFAALSGIGAARTSAPASLCIPLFVSCGPPAPSSSPTPAPSPSSPTPSGPLPAVPGLPLGGAPVPDAGSTPTPGPPAPPVVALPDPGAPTFTQPAAQLTGSSISFSGLHSVSVVSVPLADGSRVPVLKLIADAIVIADFHLTVRKPTGPTLTTDAGTMQLRGNVQVYVDSVTATLPGGTPITLGAATPPPDNALPAALLRVDLGLVGVTADSISLIPSHQALS